LTDYIYKLLEISLDTGIKELEFWEMTPAEVGRAIDSKNRLVKLEAKERATYDYILAELIVQGFSCVMSGKGKFPEIKEAYPSIFEDVIKAEEEKIQKQKDDLSTLRFLQFAQSYNERHKEKGVQNEE
jgi:hypothetical protein